VRRCAFIAAVTGLAVWPVLASAQQPKGPVVGFLNTQSAGSFPERIAAFRQGLQEIGYVDRQNVTLEYQWAEGNLDRLPALARDLVSRPVDLIVTTGAGAASLAAKAATSTIPIIFTTGQDPVKAGLVASLNQPGANITGINMLSGALGPKRLGLLQDLVPSAKRAVLLINPNNPEAEPYREETQAAARALGKPLQVLHASIESEIDAAFATLAQQRDLILIVGADAYFTGRRRQIVGLAARHSIPTIYPTREFVMAGGLVGYGTSIVEAYRQAGVYAGRVLKGEKPAMMPVLQPTKFELVINLTTAKLLGLSIPSGVMAIADEVIE